MAFAKAFKTSWIGTMLNAFNPNILKRTDQCPDYQPPSKCLLRHSTSTRGPPSSFTPITEEKASEFPEQERVETQETTIEEEEDEEEDLEVGDPELSEFAALNQVQSRRLGMEAQSRVPTIATAKPEPGMVVVGWRNQNDPENPQNWSRELKVLTTAVIVYLTFSIYMGSAIYTSSIPGVMEEFNVSETKVVLGLSLYVLGYGIGPMLFSPLSEIPSIGRNGVYIPTLFLFVILSIPTALARNYSTLMAMRFFTGFLASPALATGGATLQDIWKPTQVPFAIAFWSMGAVLGPVGAPPISGFPAQILNWRWPLYLLLMNAGCALVVVSFLLPETLGGYILLARAKRLRKLTGNSNIRSQSEIDQAQISKSAMSYETLVRPFILCLEPAVFFANLYLGFVYALLYLFFESYPIVFGETYGFNLGEIGLAFLGQAVAAAITLPLYLFYLKYVVGKQFKLTGVMNPEDRLTIAIYGSVFIPISLFMFGWTSRESIHWVVPIIATGLFLPGIFLLFQSMLVYLPMSYPLYAASILAGNDLVRSSIAAGFPLFGRPFYLNLGTGAACSCLGGISLVMIPFLVALKRYGAVLRAKSKYTTA